MKQKIKEETKEQVEAHYMSLLSNFLKRLKKTNSEMKLRFNLPSFEPTRLIREEYHKQR